MAGINSIFIWILILTTTIMDDSMAKKIDFKMDVVFIVPPTERPAESGGSYEFEDVKKQMKLIPNYFEIQENKVRVSVVTADGEQTHKIQLDLTGDKSKYEKWVVEWKYENDANYENDYRTALSSSIGQLSNADPRPKIVIVFLTIHDRNQKEARDQADQLRTNGVKIYMAFWWLDNAAATTERREEANHWLRQDETRLIWITTGSTGEYMKEMVEKGIPQVTEKIHLEFSQPTKPPDKPTTTETTSTPSNKTSNTSIPKHHRHVDVRRSKGTPDFVYGLIALALVLVLGILIGVFCFRKKRQARKKRASKKGKSAKPSPAARKRLFQQDKSTRSITTKSIGPTQKSIGPTLHGKSITVKSVCGKSEKGTDASIGKTKSPKRSPRPKKSPSQSDKASTRSKKSSSQSAKRSVRPTKSSSSSEKTMTVESINEEKSIQGEKKPTNQAASITVKSGRR